MKTGIYSLSVIALLFALISCNSGGENAVKQEESTGAAKTAGQSAVQDDVSAKNIVQVAVGSPDHTTLVTALKAAELVDVLSNAGPFTVFAPTNAAFEKLPAGTVEGLLEPAKKEALQNILEYHVAVGVYKPESFRDGQVLGEVNGSNIMINLKDGKVVINNTATIVASVTTTNGIIHIIDGVLLPE